MTGPENAGTFNSKYRLIAELGHGGMAEVFLALSSGPVGFNKLVVVKQIREQLADDPEFLAMFLDEARLAARLNHPNVVQTNEVGEEGRRYYIAMEYLEGQPLNRIVQRLSREAPGLSLAMHVRILIDALAGLHYAHELADFDGTPLQVVHRDATPHNIFVTYAGQVKVVDFGIAKALGSSAETRAGVLKGKVSYMAPEQALGEKVDRRADVFACGMMLWEALAGRRPFKGLNDVVILQKIVSGQIPSPGSVKDDIPEELEAICMKALAHDREERYPTAQAFQHALEGALERRGERPNLRDVGEQVSKTFAAERQKLKALLEAQIGNVRTTGEHPMVDPGTIKVGGRLGLPIIDAPHTESGSLHGATKTPSLPSLATTRDSVTGSKPSTFTNANAVNTAPIAAPPAPRNKLLIPLAAAGLVAVAAIVALALPKGKAEAPAGLPAVTATAHMLRIESTPPGAMVRENDKILGQTPMALPLDPAQQSARQIVLSLDGFAPYTVHQGPSGEDVRVLVPLTPMAAPPPATAADPTSTAKARTPRVGVVRPPPLPPGTTPPPPPPPLGINTSR